MGRGVRREHDLRRPVGVPAVTPTILRAEKSGLLDHPGMNERQRPRDDLARAGIIIANVER